jgi:ABC-type multidrug transport system fused ATPase/permease subunit
MTIFFSVLTGAFAIGAAAPGFAAANSAKMAGFRIFNVIERVPAIDSAAPGGQTLPALRGEIVFEDVEFAYPTRADALVLNKFNLRVPAGKTVALVGHSGCGKSTTISLLERWYVDSKQHNSLSLLLVVVRRAHATVFAVNRSIFLFVRFLASCVRLACVVSP